MKYFDRKIQKNVQRFKKAVTPIFVCVSLLTYFSHSGCTECDVMTLAFFVVQGKFVVVICEKLRRRIFV